MNLKSERWRLEKELISIRKAEEKKDAGHTWGLEKVKEVVEQTEIKLRDAIDENKILRRELLEAKNIENKEKQKTNPNFSKLVPLSSDHSSSSKIKCLNPMKTKACQTDCHPEIPYDVSYPSPPIFNSDLCFFSPRIRILSRSLPSLDSICWVKTTPEDELRDEEEEALNKLYDDQFEQFYLMERDRVKNERAEKIDLKT